MKIILKCFLTHIVACVFMYFLYLWIWKNGTDWSTWMVFVISIIFVCCGYILTGYWLKFEKIREKNSMLLIYTLSGATLLFMIATAFFSNETKLSPLIITNLPFVLLLEYQNLLPFLHGTAIEYIISALFPSGLIHIGMLLRKTVRQ